MVKPNQPRSVDELYPPKWLKAEDLQGRAVVVRIADVTVENFRMPDGQYKQAAVLAFHKLPGCALVGWRGRGRSQPVSL